MYLSINLILFGYYDFIFNIVKSVVFFDFLFMLLGIIMSLGLNEFLMFLIISFFLFVYMLNIF